VAWLGVLLAAAVALPLTQPQLLRAFIDSASTSSFGHLLRLAMTYLIVAGGIQLAYLGVNYVAEQVAWTATNAMRADLARHALGLDMPFHGSHTPGEMIERVDGDVLALGNFFSQFVMNVAWSVLLTCGIVVLVFREDWRVGAAFCVFAVVTITAILKLRTIALPYATAQRAASADLFGYIEERLAGVEDVRSSGAGHHVMRGFHRAVRAGYRAGMSAERAGAAMWTTTSALFLAGQAITLAMGAWLHGRGTMTVGTVFLLFQYTQRLREPLEIIGEQLRDFQKAAAGAERAAELFGQSASIVEGRALILPSGALPVVFENVEFAYRADEPVLRNVSMRLGAGRVLGVLGRTGSGKTTLARLVLRLYDVSSGCVRVGGVDVRDASVAELRRRVGFVTQDVQLFGASVRDNLTLFTPGIPDAHIIAVLVDLGLGAWYRALPEGLDTVLASGGGGLSAGEAQLLAFARVFLRDPGLVILDEASSRLDPATEVRIEAAVDKLLRGRTGIVIAHRLATVHRADEVLIMSDGVLVEHGGRAELASDPSSRFSTLLRSGMEEVVA
jgi:ATP-binding cassette subfamily B protein